MWLNPQETADLVTFTEEILSGKLHFSCSVGIFAKKISTINIRLGSKYASPDNNGKREIALWFDRVRVWALLEKKF